MSPLSSNTLIGTLTRLTDTEKLEGAWSCGEDPDGLSCTVSSAARTEQASTLCRIIVKIVAIGQKRLKDQLNQFPGWNLFYNGTVVEGMKFSTVFLSLGLLMAFGGCNPLDAQAQTAVQTQNQSADHPKDLPPEQIIRAFAAKETKFYKAWMEYTYHQTAEVRVISVNGLPKQEKMTTISDVVFKDDGSREVQVRRRAGDLRSVVYTMEDEEVINNLQPFALTEKELSQYNVSYAGKEKVDELNCYVFSVAPKNPKAGKQMFFEGKIWVDDQDLQIVRTVGKPVPQKKNNQFPEFETIRQMVDGKYWFPVWTHAESHLHFSSDTVHIEETIDYADYKKFGSKTSIQFETPVE
jgi:hypothetical protein